MSCSFCDGVPAPLPAGDGELFVAVPMPHTRGKLEGAAREHGVEGARRERDVVAFQVPADGLAGLLDGFQQALSAAEQRDCLAVFQGRGETLDAAGLARARSLQVLCALAAGSWLLDLIDDGRLASHFQPIMRNHGAGLSVFAFEALARGRGADGETIPPGRMFGTARTAQLMFQLDRAARLAAVEASARLSRDTPLFINFNPTAIYDPAYCLRSTIEATRRIERAPETFVFEVVESDHVEDSQRLLSILEVYRDAGFRVALDDLGAGYSSLNLLQRLHPDFVKLDMELVQGVDGDPSRQAILRGLIDIAAGLGIEVIAEGIETPGERDWLVEHGVDYLQGFLFARPGPDPVFPGSG
ncbi:EAL domain-containing protein [Arhodomonas sp. KWT2]|uniref:EAL domain-containing protein n=1 Tax=Arhodomonas sp. KWT2 TaxID=3344194 RepID=UPI0035C06EC1